MARAYTGSSSPTAYVSARQAILALAAAVFFSLDQPWKGDPKTRNGGMTERRKITPNPKTRNGRKSPQILEPGMAENPKTQNGGKSPHILKRETAENHP